MEVRNIGSSGEVRRHEDALDSESRDDPGRVTVGLVSKERESMQELLVDFITSLDGYGAAEGWPGWWGLQGPEYLAWLAEQPERDYTILMGANTYRLMSGFASQSEASESDEATEEDDSFDELAKLPKVVFSSTLKEPLSWANTRIVSGDAVEAVRAMKIVVDVERLTFIDSSGLRLLLRASQLSRGSHPTAGGARTRSSNCSTFPASSGAFSLEPASTLRLETAG